MPEADGGAGHGLMELCLLLEAQGTRWRRCRCGRHSSLGALPLARFGSRPAARRWLPGVVSGDVILTAALNGAAASPTSIPSVRARPAPSGGGWVLEGTELAVPQAHLADRIVAAGPDRRRRRAVGAGRSAGARGAARACHDNEPRDPPAPASRGVTVAPDDVLVGPDAGRMRSTSSLAAATIGLCALQVGVCEAALTTTAAYLNTRHQFGRPLSTFQGTMLQAADAAIDIEAMRVTWQNAAWRFDTGRDAADAARVAKWQASERGQRTVHTTQHLHGGMGADISYPIHRYFLWGKQIELLLGGPSAQLAKLGADIAAQAMARARGGVMRVAAYGDRFVRADVRRGDGG